MKRVFLVSCVGKKEKSPHRAAELYISDWFLKARKLVEASTCPWFILSAEHGLLAPDEVIEPYDQTLNKMPSGERRAWAEKVKQQMDDKLPAADEIVVFAGEKYREHLMSYLEERFSVTVPMEGLGIGKQLQWLDNANVEDI